MYFYSNWLLGSVFLHCIAGVKFLWSYFLSTTSIRGHDIEVQMSFVDSFSWYLLLVLADYHGQAPSSDSIPARLSHASNAEYQLMR